MQRSNCAKCQNPLGKLPDFSMIHGASDLKICAECWTAECQMLYRERTNRPDTSPLIATQLSSYLKQC